MIGQNELPKCPAPAIVWAPVKISIIIPAFNEEKLIAKTLSSVRRAGEAFSRLGWETELIVCDNNSTDRTSQIAREHGATVVFEPVNQIARARNKGAEAATGAWLVFVDADSRPSEGLFQSVAEQIQGGSCVGGGSTVRMDESYWVGNALVGLWNGVSRLRKWAAGSFIFCERRAFEELGGFSLELFASEEIEFSKRLKQLARRQKRSVVILSRHPLETSARKMRLYTRREYASFFAKLFLHPSRSLRDRETCRVWYDGRR